VAFPGHAEGAKAPGVRDWATALRVSHHLLLSHGLAVERLRSEAEGAQVAITLNLTPTRPASGAAEHVAAARRADGYFNRWFLDPVLRGRYPDDMVERYEGQVGPLDAIRDGDLETIARPIDFLGVNYYFPTQAATDLARRPVGFRAVTGDGPHTAMGWDVDSGGLLELLRRLRDDYGEVPIAITENGAAYPDPAPEGDVVEDPDRVAYLQGHLRAVAQAVQEGIDVRGYFAWSLMDNFEWEHGYAMRFGLVHVDYETQRRTVKRSGLWYRDLIRERRLDA
jgi:beta-glucosidase